MRKEIAFFTIGCAIGFILVSEKPRRPLLADGEEYRVQDHNHSETYFPQPSGYRRLISVDSSAGAARTTDFLASLGLPINVAQR